MNRIYIISLYLLSLLGMGIFHAAITPIFEGFDETAHYSWIRQIAYQGSIPLRSEIFLDKMIIDYQGPVHYGSGNPPYDSGMVYSRFFSDADLVDNYIPHYRINIPAKLFTPSQTENWQSQHPPLYYALMAPLLKLVDNHPLVTQIFILRIFSYVLALIGVLFGVLAIMRRCVSITPAQSGSLFIGFLIYPLLLPMFYPEFARIGNDSLCLFLVGVIAYLSSKWMANHGGNVLSAALGVTLGLGLLTKALFIPIIAASFVFFLILTLKNTAQKKTVDLAIDFTWIFLPAFFIGGGWYLYNFLTLGNFSGSNVAVEIAHKGGLLLTRRQYTSDIMPAWITKSMQEN